MKVYLCINYYCQIFSQSETCTLIFNCMYNNYIFSPENTKRNSKLKTRMLHLITNSDQEEEEKSIIIISILYITFYYKTQSSNDSVLLCPCHEFPKRVEFLFLKINKMESAILKEETSSCRFFLFTSYHQNRFLWSPTPSHGQKQLV